LEQIFQTEHEMATEKAIILLSGGLDSATVTAWAKLQGFEPYALTIRYGQRHAVELEAAKRVAAFFQVKKHVFFDLDLRVFGGSSLTSPLEVPLHDKVEDIGKSIPNTYVPARNTIFLSLALAFAETQRAENIVLGINAMDYSGYPDCRPEFLDAFTKMAQLATKTGVEGDFQLKFHAPLLKMTKKEIIELGLSLGVDYSLTHSCYSPDSKGRSCGKCESCLLRLNGFEQAGVADPLKYI
jgi:7-cyano-7-deazaguanine synthase